MNKSFNMLLGHLGPLKRYLFSILCAVFLTTIFFLFEKDSISDSYKVGFSYLLFFYVAELERSITSPSRKKIYMGIIFVTFLSLHLASLYLSSWLLFMITLQLIVIFGFHKVLMNESESEAVNWQNRVLHTFSESAVGSISALVAIYLLIYLAGFLLDTKFETWIPLKLAFTLIPCFIFLLRYDTPREFSKFTDGLLKFVICPLWIIYVVFLNFYALKILLSWSLPNGMVAIPTGIVFALCLGIWWTSKIGTFKIPFEKWLFFLHIPVFTLFLVGLAKRISEYGITQSRYLLILAGLFFATFLVSKMRGYLTGRSFAIRLIVLVFLAMIKVSDFMPNIFPNSDHFFSTNDHPETNLHD